MCIKQQQICLFNFSTSSYFVEVEEDSVIEHLNPLNILLSALNISFQETILLDTTWFQTYQVSLIIYVW